MADIPKDIRKLAMAAFDAPLHRDGCSLNGLVSKDVSDEVLRAIAHAIVVERDRCVRIFAYEHFTSGQRLSALILGETDNGDG